MLVHRKIRLRRALLFKLPQARSSTMDHYLHWPQYRQRMMLPMRRGKRMRWFRRPSMLMIHKLLHQLKPQAPPLFLRPSLSPPHQNPHLRLLLNPKSSCLLVMHTTSSKCSTRIARCCGLLVHSSPSSMPTSKLLFDAI